MLNNVIYIQYDAEGDESTFCEERINDHDLVYVNYEKHKQEVNEINEEWQRKNDKLQKKLIEARNRLSELANKKNYFENRGKLIKKP